MSSSRIYTTNILHYARGLILQGDRPFTVVETADQVTIFTGHDGEVITLPNEDADPGVLFSLNGIPVRSRAGQKASITIHAEPAIKLTAWFGGPTTLH